ncbi:MAG: hypothetical protein OHK0023_09130 [Anaerolineae bacterium]
MVNGEPNAEMETRFGIGFWSDSEWGLNADSLGRLMPLNSHQWHHLQELHDAANSEAFREPIKRS